MLKIPPPRLLPAAIATMATLLLLKCGVLLQTAFSHGTKPDSMMVAVANAASTDQAKEPTKGSAKKAAGTSAPPARQNGVASDPPAQDGPPPVSESEKALLQDLRRRRQDLDRRMDAVSGREAVLVAAEQRLAARVSELQALQAKLEGLDAARKEKQDASWQGLVKVYEAMKPREAATIFNDLSMPVLLQLLDRMKDAKAASVMAAMNPDKARDVTAELVQARTGRDGPGAPVAGLRTGLAGG